MVEHKAWCHKATHTSESCEASGCDAECDCGAEPFGELTEDDMRAMRDAYEGPARRRGR